MVAVHDVTEGESAALTVVAAEDDDGFRTVIETWLSGPGYDLRTAADGAEALGALDEGVDVFLCDRNMPEFTGHEVVDRLDETGYEGPVVVLSAYEPDGHLGEDDVARYLTKPIDREDLQAAVDEVASSSAS